MFFKATIFPNTTLKVFNIKTTMFGGLSYLEYSSKEKLILRDKLYLERGSLL